MLYDYISLYYFIYWMLYNLLLYLFSMVMDTCVSSEQKHWKQTEKEEIAKVIPLHQS